MACFSGSLDTFIHHCIMMGVKSLVIHKLMIYGCEFLIGVGGAQILFNCLFITEPKLCAWKHLRNEYQRI